MNSFLEKRWLFVTNGTLILFILIHAMANLSINKADSVGMPYYHGLAYFIMYCILILSSIAIVAIDRSFVDTKKPIIVKLNIKDLGEKENQHNYKQIGILVDSVKEKTGYDIFPIIEFTKEKKDE